MSNTWKLILAGVAGLVIGYVVLQSMGYKKTTRVVLADGTITYLTDEQKAKMEAGQSLENQPL